MASFQIELTPDDNGTFLVTCPALPGVVTFGETEADCIGHARDAIEEWIAEIMAGGGDLPTDAPQPGAMTVTLPPLIGLKTDLYRALRAAGITRAELARRLGWTRTSVDRLFDLDHVSRLGQLEAAAGALGGYVKAEVVYA